MGQGILVDTNTAIDYLADLLPVNAVEIIEGAKSNISVVTRIEFLSIISRISLFCRGTLIGTFRCSYVLDFIPDFVTNNVLR
ncbi:MAG: hypothetical protein ACR2KZ_04950 [Segetibacter sp.]